MIATDDAHAPRCRWAAVACAAALGAYALAALGAHRARVAPERSSLTGALGPAGHVLEAAADRRIEYGLAQLDDSLWPPAERFEVFLGEMRAAEALLARSLAAQPASATALAKLAAVRFELSPPLSAQAAREQLDLVRLAGEMAPDSPLVHLRLAELLLKMGRDGDAGPYLRRAVDLDPAQAGAAVRLLAERGVEAAAIAGVLPPHARVLAALERPFAAQGRLADYVELVERSAGPREWSAPGVLAAYAGACLASGQAERLRLRLDAAGPLDSAPAEAERLRQRSRSRVALGQLPAALEDARAACRLAPESPQHARHRGDVALAAGETDEALAAYRLALDQVARGSGDPGQRALLYARIGQVEERRGSGDRAYDAYRMALRLDPNQAQARRRVDELQRVAGTGPGSP